MVNLKSVELVLASGSPRRVELLRQAGYTFEVRVPDLKEDDLSAADPRALVQSLAYAKARQIADTLSEGIVLGADTVVCLGDEVIGKAHDAVQAREILGRLTGTTHSVLTGVCLVDASRGERLCGCDETRITMKKLTDQELEEYVRSGEGIGKAGAYAIQEKGDRFVERVDGSFTNVVGLPMEMLEQMLSEMMRLVRPS